MSEEVRYRPKLRQILDHVIGNAYMLADLNVAKFSDNTGVSRATIYNWLAADTENPDDWLKRYDPEVAFKLERFFFELLGEKVQIIERRVIGETPDSYETSSFTP